MNDMNDDQQRAVQLRMWALEHVCPDWETEARLEAAEQIFDWVMDVSTKITIHLGVGDGSA